MLIPKFLKKKKIDVYELQNKRLFFSINDLSKLLKNKIKKDCKNILISNIHYNNIILTLLAKKIDDLKIILVERSFSLLSIPSRLKLSVNWYCSLKLFGSGSVAFKF